MADAVATELKLKSRRQPRERRGTELLVDFQPVVITVRNATSHVIEAGGKVIIRDDDTSFVGEATFPRILVGETSVQPVPMPGGFEHISWSFVSEDNPGDWRGFGSASNAGTANLELTDA